MNWQGGAKKRLKETFTNRIEKPYSKIEINSTDLYQKDE